MRCYGTEPHIWDGDPGCSHDFNLPAGIDIRFRPGYNTQVGNNLNPEIFRTLKHKRGETNPGKEAWYKENGGADETPSSFCSRCGAWFGELGLEPSVSLYLAHILQVFGEVRRVLKPSGSVWVVFGDTFSNSGSNSQANHTSFGKLTQSGYKTQGHKAEGLPSKCLCMIPYRFAIAMTDELGFLLRNIIIWKKCNAIPQSVKDRFTVDYEPVFFFTKTKKYFFEQQFERIAESSWNDSRKDKGRQEHSGKSSTRQYAMSATVINSFGRNKRCVWTIPTHPFKEAHFATFPPALIEPMINAGCPQYVCRKCGKPRDKIYKGKSSSAFNIRVRDAQKKRIKYTDRRASKEELSNYEESSYGGDGIRFIGRTDCGCRKGWDSGIVLDPFAGSGTTGVVAKRLGRRFILIELKPEYCAMAEKRLKNRLNG